jgi:hypothetical protein
MNTTSDAINMIIRIIGSPNNQILMTSQGESVIYDLQYVVAAIILILTVRAIYQLLIVLVRTIGGIHNG